MLEIFSYAYNQESLYPFLHSLQRASRTDLHTNLLQYDTVVPPRDPLPTSFHFPSAGGHTSSAWLHPRQLRRHAKLSIVQDLEQVEMLRWLAARYGYRASQVEVAWSLVERLGREGVREVVREVRVEKLIVNHYGRWETIKVDELHGIEVRQAELKFFEVNFTLTD